MGRKIEFFSGDGRNVQGKIPKIKGIGFLLIVKSWSW
jgi:hypothetical protein